MMDFAIEEMSLSAWPALQTILYDGWVVRFAEGHTKRSNSVNPLYASTLSLNAKIEVCERMYAARGLPTIFKITEAEAQRPIDEALAAAGYARIDETRIMALDLADISPAALGSVPAEGAAEGGISLADAFDDEWIDAFCACGNHRKERAVIARILDNVVPRAVVVAAREGGAIVGCGYGAMERGWVGLYDIAVREDRRRRGYGELVVRSILERARELGTERAYLQVVAGNATAERLYERLGFREIYRYWYRKKA